MKNIIITIYTTIFSLLLITVFFTIAELNIIAKTPYTNDLQQSVVMNASYLISCKLIIQIVLTYVFGNILYNKVKDIHNKHTDIPQGKENNPLWKNYPERMTRHQEAWNKLVKDKPGLNLTPIEEEDYNKVNTVQFDPIDQIDALDKNGVDTEGILLSEILNGVKKPPHTFKREDIEENGKWKEVYVKDLPSKMSAYEVVVKDKKNRYYVKVG